MNVEASRTISPCVVLTYVVNYIENSIRGLQPEVYKLLLTNYPKKFAVCSHRNTIKKYIDGIISGLQSKEDVYFDTVIGEIHFINGYIDIKTQTFKKRDFGSHFVRSVIEREYKPSTEKQREYVMSMISKIIPEKENREAVLQAYGGCLSGKITKLKKIFWFVGKGSAGKTTLNDLTQFALSKYTVELKPDTFCLNSTDQSKVLNTFRDRPNIYFAFINEMSDSKLDCKTLKNFAEGKVSVTQLYMDGLAPVNHKCMLFVAMNDLPNMVIDTGMKRRVWALYLKSSFVDSKKKVDESKHIYLKDEDFQETMTPFLDAWVDILVGYSQQYVNGMRVKVSKDMKETASSLTQNNDTFQDFIDGYLTVDPKANFRIGKHRMYEYFKEKFPEKKHLTITQVLSSLKDKGLDCDYSKKSNNIRGCFMGVCIKKQELQESDDEDDTDMGIDKSDQKIDLVKLQNKKIMELEEKIKQMEQSTETKTKDIKSKCSTVESVEDETETEDEEEHDNTYPTNYFYVSYKAPTEEQAEAGRQAEKLKNANKTKKTKIIEEVKEVEEVEEVEQKKKKAVNKKKFIKHFD